MIIIQLVCWFTLPGVLVYAALVLTSPAKIFEDIVLDLARELRSSQGVAHAVVLICCLVSWPWVIYSVYAKNRA